ncbi:MAG: DUF6261 family protein [Cytophagales bacterium]
MFNYLNLSNLRNGEFYQFLSDVNGIVELNNPQILKLEKLYNQQKAITDAIASVFKVDRSSAFTEELLALDARRDEAIIGIALLAESYTHHYEEGIRKQALLLVDNLALYGPGIARQSFPMETATLTNIVNDWSDKPAFISAVAALQLSPWLMELKTANKAFNDKYLARAQEEGGEMASNIKEKRAEAVAIWYKLRNLIEGKYNIAEDEGSGSEPYKKLVNSLNAIVDKYNLLLASRAGKKISNEETIV